MHDTRRTRLVLGALLAAALILITLDFRGASSPAAGLRGIGGAIFGTAENLVGGVARPVTGFFRGATSAAASSAEISALQQRIVRLRAQLSLAQLSKAEEAQLQRLLQLAGRGGYRIVAANVVAVGPAFENTVTIDVGSSDGVKPNQTVLNGDGLVGTVTSVSAQSATVLLDTDASATAGVRVAGTGQIGAVTGLGESSGTGPPQLRLQVFDASAVLRPGEQLVTFGSVGGRPYVPGVPVGVITQVVSGPGSLTKIAYVRPFADNSAVGVVGVVIQPPRKDPRDSVLAPTPPPPSPSASPPASATPSGSGATPSAPAPASSRAPTLTGG